MTTYMASFDQLELADFNTKCSKRECEETGCSFPDCSMDHIRCFTKQEFKNKIETLRAEGHTVNNVSSI